MITVNYIKENLDLFKSSMERRGYTVDIELIISLDSKRRQLITEIQTLQSRKNTISDLIPKLQNDEKDKKNEMVSEVKAINEKILNLNEELNKLEAELDYCLSTVPNILDDRVPTGKDESDNVVIKEYGTKQTYDFEPLTHERLGVDLGMLNLNVAAKIAGSRFNVLFSSLSGLYRALINFMLDMHIKENGFIETTFPHLVNASSMYGTGQLPKFDDNFKTTDGFYLIPTGEVPMVNFVSNMILSKDVLPLRFVGHSPCYRSEAGAAGKDTKGIFRQHQFDKVELVTICSEEQSENEHLHIVSSAESILQKLNLPYRVSLLCSSDIGFASRLTYDIEVWLPGQKNYREISSCSNTGSFQAVRMKTKYKDNNEKKYVHTLNGSGLAIGRTLIAILENYQEKDGSIRIPLVLQDYCGFDVIQKNDAIKEYFHS